MSFISYAMIYIGAASVSYYLMKFIVYLDTPKRKHHNNRRRAA